MLLPPDFPGIITTREREEIDIYASVYYFGAGAVSPLVCRFLKRQPCGVFTS